jgi:beta-glucosidase-like glycosyl hydrolase/CubicO group peptidase (beta-lactamase class C family)
MKFRRLVFFVFLIFTVLKNSVFAGNEPPYLKFKADKWVTEQLGKMTLEEKIAQLITISVYPKQGDESKIRVLEQIRKYKPGGILIMQATPVEAARWINEFQQTSKIPLLVAIDGEWGISMRVDSVQPFPYAQAIGAVRDSSLVYQMGRDMAMQLKTMGIHMNFAPVADINTNPNNPVINFRSFGEDKNNVAQKAWWVAQGMQDTGVIPVAKHFPGHGDTDTDSHLSLPVLSHSKSRMDSLEIFPFRYLSERGIIGMMTAHLNVPSIDNSGIPSSLSKKIVNDYLKNEIGFKGFVVTDAINMKGVRTEKGNTEVEALIAGNDMLEFVPDVQKAIQSVKLAVEQGKLSLEEINEKCKTVLAVKRWANLNNYKPADTRHLTSVLNAPNFEVTNRKLVKGSFTALINDGILPVQGLDTLKIASIIIGDSHIVPFQKMMDKYTVVDHFVLSKTATQQEWTNLRSQLKNYNLVISGIQGINIYPSSKYGTTEIQRKAVSEIIQENNSIFVFFGNAYALKHFDTIHGAKGLILAYQNTTLAQELAAQLIFGAFDVNGKLPVTIDKRFKLNDGIELKKNNCLAYTIPEEVGINSKLLNREIDSLANFGLRKEAYPGCQVLIAKNGNVIFHKTYGYHTYKNEMKVLEDDIYDWASVSKVTGSLPAIMKLVDEEKINLDVPIGQYRKDLVGSNKEKLKMRDILTHQAGLIGWISFWQMALDENKQLDKHIFSDSLSDKFNIRVSSHLYMNEDFSAVMIDTLKKSELKSKNKYVYSDLGFHLFPGLISNVTGQNYEEYLYKTFYRPLGAITVGFNPHKRFPLNRIIPTENDDFFRNEILQGFVHDEGAAMMGGISGNAGLFGSANDLAKIFQMYLQKGNFGGKQYISEETVNEFIKIQFPENNNRRGLGFDKPYMNNEKYTLKDAYPAVNASKNSFGHSGYTGTFVWADPDNGLLYIFMSNRVHPTRDNTKLYNLNIRTTMHQKIYDCIKAGNN